MTVGGFGVDAKNTERLVVLVIISPLINEGSGRTRCACIGSVVAAASAVCLSNECDSDILSGGKFGRVLEVSSSGDGNQGKGTNLPFYFVVTANFTQESRATTQNPFKMPSLRVSENSSARITYPVGEAFNQLICLKFVNIPHYIDCQTMCHPTGSRSNRRNIIFRINRNGKRRTRLRFQLI